MHPIKRFADTLIRIKRDLIPQFRADGLAVSGRNMSFLNEMEGAWREVERVNKPLPIGLPDIRWRAAIALWAARHAMNLEGDLVECGVFTGILSTVICHSIPDFGDKKLWLFDTFEGLPTELVGISERRNASGLNENYYNRVNSEELIRKSFGKFSFVKIIKGILPESIPADGLNKISYLSIDLNYSEAEIKVIELLWGRLVPGAIVILDDYGFDGHADQHTAWNQFALSKGVPIAPLPTGQGLIIKNP